MAIVPDYKSGTASVTAGQRAVTGTGTAWLVSPNEPVVRPGDLFGRAGLWVPIESVTDNTHLTLAEDWSGATLNNSPYSIRFQADASRYTATARAIVELLANGILASLAAQPGAADKLPFFTGANTFGLATLTAAARSLLDDTDTSSMLSTLGVSAFVKTLLDDASASAVLSTLGVSAFIKTLLDDPDIATALNTLNAVNKAGDTMTGGLRSNVAHVINQDASISVGSTFQGNFSGLGFQYVINNVGTPFRYLTGWFSGGVLPMTEYTLTYSRFFRSLEATCNYAINEAVQIRCGSVTTAGVFNYGLAMDYQLSNVGASSQYLSVYTAGTMSRILQFTNSGAGSLGNFFVNGTLSKGAGTFLIDHPLDPLNKDLLHAFIEGPRNGLMYWGKVKLVDGRATIDIDRDSNSDHPMTSGTFAALTINATVHALQNLDGFARLKPGPIVGATFEIICEDEACTDEVSWLVMAERNDAFVRSSLDPNTDDNGRFVPERMKEDA